MDPRWALAAADGVWSVGGVARQYHYHWGCRPTAALCRCVCPNVYGGGTEDELLALFTSTTSQYLRRIGGRHYLCGWRPFVTIRHDSEWRVFRIGFKQTGRLAAMESAGVLAGCSSIARGIGNGWRR